MHRQPGEWPAAQGGWNKRQARHSFANPPIEGGPHGEESCKSSGQASGPTSEPKGPGDKGAGCYGKPAHAASEKMISRAPGRYRTAIATAWPEGPVVPSNQLRAVFSSTEKKYATSTGFRKLRRISSDHWSGNTARNRPRSKGFPAQSPDDTRGTLLALCRKTGTGAFIGKPAGRWPQSTRGLSVRCRASTVRQT